MVNLRSIYLDILRKIKLSTENKDVETLYYYMCLIEQFLSDYRIAKQELITWAEITKLRLFILEIATLYFTGKSIPKEFHDKHLNLYNFLESLDLEENSDQIDTFFLPEPKIAESLSHFGVYPQDFFIESLSMNYVKQRVFIVGIRSAGSYFAPAVCVALNLNTYATVRPGVEVRANVRELVGIRSDFPFLMTQDEVYEFENEVSNSDIVIIADEGPGTGATFKSAIKAVLQCNPVCEVIVLHTRRLISPLVGNCKAIYIHPKTFYDTYKKYILDELWKKIRKQGCKIVSIRVASACEQRVALRNEFSLREHESPKILFMVFTRKEERKHMRRFVAKFIGYNGLGKIRYDKLTKLAKFTPFLVMFHNGVVVYEYVEDENIELGTLHLELVVEYFYAFFKVVPRRRKIPYWEYIGQVSDIFLGNELLSDITKRNISCFFEYAQRCLRKEECILTEPDWKLEKHKWIFQKEKILKLDNFHFKDYDDSPIADIFIQIAGFSIEFGLRGEQENIMVTKMSNLLNKECKMEIIILNKLFYLMRKINYYDYIVKNLQVYCLDFDVLSNHLAELNKKFHRLLETLPNLV